MIAWGLADSIPNEGEKTWQETYGDIYILLDETKNLFLKFTKAYKMQHTLDEGKRMHWSKHSLKQDDAMGGGMCEWHEIDINVILPESFLVIFFKFI